MNPTARKFALTVLLLAALLIPGCAGGSDPRDNQEEDILAAIQIYLREQRGMNPSEMGMEITHLVLDGDQAQVTIQFSAPGGGNNLEFQYVLNQSDDGWTVDSSQGQGGHGEGGMPPQHPPIPENPPQEAGSENPPENS